MLIRTESVTDWRRTIGYCVYIGGNLVSWKSKKQDIMSKSSAEAEYQAVTQAICELVWLMRLFNLGLRCLVLRRLSVTISCVTYHLQSSISCMHKTHWSRLSLLWKTSPECDWDNILEVFRPVSGYVFHVIGWFTSTIHLQVGHLWYVLVRGSVDILLRGIIVFSVPFRNLYILWCRRP